MRLEGELVTEQIERQIDEVGHGSADVKVARIDEHLDAVVRCELVQHRPEQVVPFGYISSPENESNIVLQHKRVLVEYYSMHTYEATSSELIQCINDTFFGKPAV